MSDNFSISKPHHSELKTLIDCSSHQKEPLNFWMIFSHTLLTLMIISSLTALGFMAYGNWAQNISNFRFERNSGTPDEGRVSYTSSSSGVKTIISEQPTDIVSV